ncbi:hypothetical protein [Candidatus Villigracilis saccharophilus]|nr:hypothetical protein [Anaerolineales bacterium]
MIAMIYHDIRSPLGNVVSSLEMMGELMPVDGTATSMLISRVIRPRAFNA